MKKIVKIVSITLGSLLLLLTLAISTLLWVVFTPQRLTPIVQSQLDKYLLCESKVDEVELTFFSSFPDFSLQLSGFRLINPTQGAPGDTLLAADKVYFQVDLEKLFNDNHLDIYSVSFVEPRILLFTDSLGLNNYSIMASDSTETDTTAFKIPFDLIDLKKLRIERGAMRYIDEKSRVDVAMTGITTDITGAIDSSFVDAVIALNINDLSAKYDTIQYVQHKPLSAKLALKVGTQNKVVELKEALLNSASVKIEAKGSLLPDPEINDGYLVNQEVTLSIDNLSDLVALIPSAYASMIPEIVVGGNIYASGKVDGKMNQKELPIFDGTLRIANVTVDLKKHPAYALRNISMAGDLLLDMNSKTTSYIKIEEAKVEAMNSLFEFKGLGTDFFTDPRFKGEVKADIHLATISKEFLTEYGYSANGRARAQFNLETTQSQAINVDLNQIRLGGKLHLTDFSARSKKDSIYAHTKNTKVVFATNVKKVPNEPNFFKGDITSTDFFAEMGTSTKVDLQQLSLNLLTSDVRDTTSVPRIKCTYEASYIDAQMDTLSASLHHLKGKLAMGAAKDHANYPFYVIEAKADSMNARFGTDRASIEYFDTQFTLLDITTEKEAMLRWIPKGTIRMDNALISTQLVKYDIAIPTIDLDFKPNHYIINSSRLIIGDSDFELKGELSDVYRYFNKKAPLKGEFTFTSEMTDINQLMTMTSGEPSEETAPLQESVESDSLSSGSSPYMVPLNIDVTLNTEIKKARFNETLFSDIQGDVYIKEGKLVMDKMNLVSPGGRMIVTAIYRTPRRNHLFAGINYHLMDVQIAELLKMIPDIDTIMPMLRSFGGSGEFHLIAETYLDSLYNLKMSTLRGAASITGQDLILMDGETFSEIANMLRFNKKTVNRVDSLSAEFTIFRNEIDIYPFQLVMDKYKAVISGRHNLDMSFDYHISVTDCPLPIRLGLDVSGTLDKLRYKLAPCRYARLYKPAQRKVVDEVQLNLQKMIKDALTKSIEK